MAKSPLNVVIIGGSLAGLMHGVMLKQLGHNIHIFEQYPTSVREGQAAGMSIGAYGQELLRKHDRIQGRPQSVTASKLEVVDGNLKITESRPVPFKLTTWKAFYYRLRANFDGLKSDYIPIPPPDSPEDGSVTYDVGKRVKTVSYVKEKGVTVTYEDIESGIEDVLDCDLVIAADGAGSSIRKLLYPNLQIPYAGILTWRGVVPEHMVSQQTLDFLLDKCIRYYGDRYYIAVYLIPGEDGSVKPGERHVNLVWYDTCGKDSSEYLSIMTDIDGMQHQRTVPFGKVRPEVWAKKQAYGNEHFPGPIKELVNKIDTPFVTGIYDCVSPRASHFDGKLFLVGDAFALFRPHAAQSTNQCAMHCLLLAKFLAGETDLQSYEDKVSSFANTTLHWSRAIGSEYMDSFVGHLYHEIRFRLARKTRSWRFRL
ncbi:hypothetical protein CJF32_00002877 [Rutstroemia sp. NJR-2017a WRK4]|nr:hypothetical protein CJF32_00002877 [Rutstroemia sp. NJR-2017a WRK4]